MGNATKSTFEGRGLHERPLPAHKGSRGSGNRPSGAVVREGFRRSHDIGADRDPLTTGLPLRRPLIALPPSSVFKDRRNHESARFLAHGLVALVVKRSDSAAIRLRKALDIMQPMIAQAKARLEVHHVTDLWDYFHWTIAWCMWNAEERHAGREPDPFGPLWMCARRARRMSTRRPPRTAGASTTVGARRRTARSRTSRACPCARPGRGSPTRRSTRSPEPTSSKRCRRSTSR